MGIISKTYNYGNISEVKMEQAKEYNGVQRTIGDKIKAMAPQVAFEELEMAFKTDAINFNAINKSVQMIMSGGFKNFIHKKPSVVRKYQKFFEEIGYIGKDITFEELLESIFRCQMVYGNAFVELVYNRDDTKIVDLAMIDPKKIDYAKTTDGKIILDNNGKSIGYSVKLDQGTYAEGDEYPNEFENIVQRKSNEIFILAKRICHFKLYTIGDEFYGIGLLEAAYRSVIYKKNIEKGQANSIYARGFSPLVAFVGNERRMGTPNDIKGVLDKLKRLNYQRYEAFPDWVKLQAIEMNNSDLTTTALKDLRTDQIASLSAPEALVSGSGEATNRATLGDQRTLWEFTLKDIIKKTLSYFKKYILNPINRYNGYGGVPDIEWGELRAEDIRETIDEIIKILTSKSGNITEEFRDDLEEDLRQMMGIKNYTQKKKKPLVNEEEIKKKEEENKKTISDVKNNLININTQLKDTTLKLQELEKEKNELFKSYNSNLNEVIEKNSLDKKQVTEEINNISKEFENKIENLNLDIEKKLKEKDEIITSLNKTLELSKKNEDSINDKLEQAFKEKQIRLMDKKQKLLEKLEKDFENDK